MANVTGPPGICVSPVLASSQASAGAVGTAAVIDQGQFNSESIDVIVSYLLPPSTFGPGLNGFTFTLVDPNTGQEVARQRMTELQYVPTKTGAWAGTIVTTLDMPFPQGLLMIFASSDDLLGPQVASANLAACTELPGH